MKRTNRVVGVVLGFLGVAIAYGCGQEIPLLPQPPITSSFQSFGLNPMMGIGTLRAPLSNYPLDGYFYTQVRPQAATGDLVCNGQSLTDGAYSMAAFVFIQNQGEFVVQSLVDPNLFYGIRFSVRYDGINDGSNENGTLTLSNFQGPSCRRRGSSLPVDCSQSFLQPGFMIPPSAQVVYNFSVTQGPTVTLTSGNDPYLLCGTRAQSMSVQAKLTNVQSASWFKSYYNHF